MRLSPYLFHPLARGRNIDSPETTALRRRLVKEKRFLHEVYREWYNIILGLLPVAEGRVLEVGSGPGFLSELLPELITSEIFPVPDANLVLDSQYLPFRTGSLRAIVMTDVFHHIPGPALFLREAARCTRRGGAIVMIEPWNTRWSCWIYTHFHHEPFRPDAERWDFPSTGPLSGANGALPWMVFERDKSTFNLAHPQWRVMTVRLMMPFRYLLSGGMAYRAFMPASAFPIWRWIERALTPFMAHLAMFACIVLERTEVD